MLNDQKSMEDGLAGALRSNCHTLRLYWSPMGWTELDALAKQQYGLATRAELLAILSEGDLRYGVATGRVVPHRPGVYRVAGAPEHWEQDVCAVCRSTDAIASHKTAARLWGIAYVPAQRIEVLVSEDRRIRLPGVRAHRTNLLPPSHVTALGGIPVTSGARTIVDVSAVLGDETLEKAVNDAIRRRVTSVADLRACFEELAGRGRRRVAHLRPILEARLAGFDPGGSDPELRVLRWLAGAGLPRPVQQLWVVAGGQRFCLDFAFVPWKVGLDYDGWDPHGTRSAFDYDRDRRDELELAGWTVLQVTSRTSRQAVVRRVRRALGLAGHPDFRSYAADPAVSNAQKSEGRAAG